MTYRQKTTQHWRKKLRKIQTNGSMYHVHGLEELSSKWPYYPKRFIDSTQFLLKYEFLFLLKYDIFHRYRTNISEIYMEP